MLNSFLNADSEIPRLTNNEARIYDGKLTIDESYKSLWKQQVTRNDGLTAKCYRAFWHTLGILWLWRVVKFPEGSHYYLNWEKKDKDKRDLSNWRPISVINVDVKIGSKAIAKRLENVLPNIIHYNQCAYVKGRTTFDAVTTIEDVMEFSERYNLERRMICIDFKKGLRYCHLRFSNLPSNLFRFWSIIFAMDSHILQQYLYLLRHNLRYCCKMFVVKCLKTLGVCFCSALCSWKGSESRRPLLCLLVHHSARNSLY